MAASRVETEPKPRWLEENYKADLKKYPEEITDLCPIVITTIDCRATVFKDADGDILTVTSRSKDGLVLTAKVTSRIEEKDGKYTEVKVPDGKEHTITKTVSEGPDRYEFENSGDKNGVSVEAMDFKFDRTNGTGKGKKANAKTKISIMCHSMGNYVLKKMAPNKPAEEGGEKDKYINEQGERVEQKTDAFRFDNIFMVAADVRAVTFDETLGEETIKVDGKEVKDHDGKDILRLAKHKVHVCWHERDKALLVRRGTNWGRPALGKNGLESKYMKNLIKPGLDPKGKLVDKYCKEWADQKGGMRHGYQAIPDAQDYYLKQMTANCDNLE